MRRLQSNNNNNSEDLEKKIEELQEDLQKAMADNEKALREKIEDSEQDVKTKVEDTEDDIIKQINALWDWLRDLVAAANGVDLVLMLGDLSYQNSSGGDQNWFDNYIGAIKNISKPARGNHDGSGGSDTRFPQLFNFLTSWLYHVRIGNALCITLDSDTRDAAIGGANYNHLVNRFQQFQNDPNVLWRFVYFHHPF